MKNVKLLLLIISSIALLTNCGRRLGTEKNLPTSSPTLISSPTPKSTSELQAPIDNKIFQEYQKSQKKLIELLDRRVKTVKENERQKLGEELRDELVVFNRNLDLLEESIQNTEFKTKRIVNIKTILNFGDLSTKQQVESLQNKLEIQDIGEGKGLYGAKTNQALTKKIRTFSDDLQKLYDNSQKINPTTSPSSSPATEPPKTPSEFNWLATVFSLISMILSALALYKTRSRNKRTKKIQNGGNPVATQSISSSLYNSTISDDSDLAKNISISSEIENLPNQFRGVESDIKSINLTIFHLQSELKYIQSTLYQKDNFNDPSQPPSPNLSRDKNNQVYNATPSSRDTSNLAKIISSPSHFQASFIQEYNQDSSKFYNQYVDKEVVEDEYNIGERRSGKVKTVNLSIVSQRTGDYWIFSRQNQYMLVPSSEARINKFSQDTVKAMFDYSEFRATYQKIRLIEPAIVEAKGGGYQLVSRGRIEFE